MAGIHHLRPASSQLDSHRTLARKDTNTAQQTPSTPSKAQPQTDAVSLSSQGKAIGQLHHSMATEPSFDRAKVAAIKEAISNGSYRVDAEKLADNMRRLENDL